MLQKLPDTNDAFEPVSICIFTECPSSLGLTQKPSEVSSTFNIRTVFIAVDTSSSEESLTLSSPSLTVPTCLSFLNFAVSLLFPVFEPLSLLFLFLHARATWPFFPQLLQSISLQSLARCPNLPQWKHGPCAFVLPLSSFCLSHAEHVLLSKPFPSSH